MANVRVELDTTYQEDIDMTIILRYTYVGDHIQKLEVVGLYHGEPNDSDTQKFSTKGTTINYF